MCFTFSKPRTIIDSRKIVDVRFRFLVVPSGSKRGSKRVFPRWARVARIRLLAMLAHFPTLNSRGCLFPRACHLSLFSRAWRCLHSSPHLVFVTRVSTFGRIWMLRVAWQLLHVTYSRSGWSDVIAHIFFPRDTVSLFSLKKHTFTFTTVFIT